MADSINIDLNPFVAVALGQVPSCYKALDKLYQTSAYRYRFYRAAITNKYYKHRFITKGGLLEVEYARKALGIVVFFAECDDNDFLKVGDAFKKILQRAYPYAHSYVLAQTVFTPSKFLAALAKKHKGLDNIGDIELNSNIAVALLLALNQSKKIIPDSCWQKFSFFAYHSLYGMQKSVGSKITLDTAPPELLTKINDTEAKYADLVKQVQSKIIQADKNREKYYFVFDFLGLSLTSIVENTKTDKDMFRKLAMAYHVTTPTEKVSEESFRAYIFAATIMYRLGQAYNDVKEHYFANNKEIMYAETEALEMDKRKLNMEKRNLEHRIEELSGEIKELSRQNNQLQAELAASESTKTELIALREMVFQQSKKNQEDADRKASAKDYSELKLLKAVFVGGRPVWQKRMKELLPNATFIDTDALNFDTGLLRDITVYVNTTYISHAMYYRVVENLPDSSTFVFLNHDNIDLCLDSLVTKIHS